MDEETKYNESCNFMRHYSNCSLTIRVIAIAQGLVLMSAWGIAIKNNVENMLLILISVFGILFTLLLHSMHRGYLTAVNVYAGVAEQLEASKNNNNPVSTYNAVRSDIYKNILVKAVTIHATFTLVGLAFIGLLIFSCYRYVGQ